MNAITYDSLPQAVMEINNKLDRLLSRQGHPEPETDKLITIDELIDFLPEHPARQTIYQWITGRLIPYQKHGRRLYFRKSEIQNWLANGRQV